jgi:hypothetical protein
VVKGCDGGRQRSERERQNPRALMQRGGSAGGRREMAGAQRNGRTVRHCGIVDAYDRHIISSREVSLIFLRENELISLQKIKSP